MFPAILSMLTSRAGLAVIAGALVLGVIGVQTLRLQHAKADLTSLRKADAEALAQAVARQKVSASISVASQAKSASDRVQIVTRYKTLLERVPQVGEGALNCSPPASWVALWNEAAR